MAEITEETTLEELAGIVSATLAAAGIQVVLVGGAVVSIYTKNAYESGDLDFIVHSEMFQTRLEKVMTGMGFAQQGRMFVHPRASFFVEFPPGPIAIGRSMEVELDTLMATTGVVRLLSPTSCVCDRLAAFFHWNDRRSLEHALMVAKNQPINLTRIKKWAKGEGGAAVAAKMREFERRMKEPE